MLWTPASRPSFTVDNWGTNPSATPGTSVTPGASNAEGSWTQVLSAIAQEASGLWISMSDGRQAGGAAPHLLDIGWDEAGGSSYTEKIGNIVCGASAAVADVGGGGGLQFYFPIRIPSGASVAVRIQGSNATAGTVRVQVRAYGQNSAGWLLPVGQYAETVGTITNSSGVSFTPGNAADGSWTSLGTTSRACWWWQLAYHVNNSTITAEQCYIDLAHGDGSNKHLITRLLHAGGTNENVAAILPANLLPSECYCPVAAGATLYVRGRCVDAPDSGYSAVAIGIGG